MTKRNRRTLTEEEVDGIHYGHKTLMQEFSVVSGPSVQREKRMACTSRKCSGHMEMCLHPSDHTPAHLRIKGYPKGYETYECDRCHVHAYVRSAQSIRAESERAKLFAQMERDGKKVPIIPS